MNKLFALIMPIGIAMGSFLPLQAQPSVQLFDRGSWAVGTGYQGQAAPRNGEQWGRYVYAKWTLGDGTEEKIVVMSRNGKLESYNYNRSRNKSYLSWSIPGYTVEVLFYPKRTGYESSGGNGLMRIHKKAGDSQIIGIRVDEGC